MKFDYPAQVRIAIIFLVVLTVGSGLNHLYHDVIHLPAGKDEITSFDRRCSELRTALPDHGTIGFLNSPDADMPIDLHVAQYVLAPLIVTTSLPQNLVVANVSESGLPKPPSGRLVLERDFGNGVALFKMRHQR